MKPSKYLLHGIDDLIIDNVTKFENVIKSDSNDILCVGTGLEDVCNYKCIYCYAGDIEKKNFSDMLTIAEYKDLFSQASNLGCKSVIITGALSRSEPLLSKKLIPILEHLSSMGIISVIFTNLSVLGNEQLCQKVHGFSCGDLAEYFFSNKVSFMISCDSILESTYNEIVDINNQFECFMLALENIEKAGYSNSNNMYNDELISRVGVSTVVTRENFPGLPDMNKYFHNKNWQYICKFPSLMGNALKNKGSFFEPSEANELRYEIQKYSDKPETLSLIYNNKKYCLMNQLGIAFNSLGQPLTCLSGDVAFGGDSRYNIKNKSLIEIIQSKKATYSMNAGECPKKTKFYSFKGEPLSV